MLGEFSWLHCSGVYVGCEVLHDGVFGRGGAWPMASSVWGSGHVQETQLPHSPSLPYPIPPV